MARHPLPHPALPRDPIFLQTCATQTQLYTLPNAPKFPINNVIVLWKIFKLLKLAFFFLRILGVRQRVNAC